jgi:hypothetical protein
MFFEKDHVNGTITPYRWIGTAPEWKGPKRSPAVNGMADSLYRKLSVPKGRFSDLIDLNSGEAFGLFP